MNNAYIMFLYLHFEKIIKDQIKLNEYSININARTFVHNFKRIWPELFAELHTVQNTLWNVNIFYCIWY